MSPRTLGTPSTSPGRGQPVGDDAGSGELGSEVAGSTVGLGSGLVGDGSGVGVGLAVGVDGVDGVDGGTTALVGEGFGVWVDFGAEVGAGAAGCVEERVVAARGTVGWVAVAVLPVAAVALVVAVAGVTVEETVGAVGAVVSGS
jgi:hypothetical protein